MSYLLDELNDLKYLLDLAKSHSLASVKHHPHAGIILDSLSISSNHTLRRAINKRILEVKKQVKIKGLAP